MGKEPKNTTPKYNDIVERLEDVVSQLESGQLSLEDSLEKFAEGVKLVESGEELLRSAERRIEVLLSKEGATTPLDENASTANLKPSAKVTKKEPSKDTDEDVPF